MTAQGCYSRGDLKAAELIGRRSFHLIGHSARYRITDAAAALRITPVPPLEAKKDVEVNAEDTQNQNEPAAAEAPAAETAEAPKAPRRRASRRVSTATVAPSDEAPATTVTESAPQAEVAPQVEVAPQAEAAPEASGQAESAAEITAESNAEQVEAAPKKRTSRGRKKAAPAEQTGDAEQAASDAETSAVETPVTETDAKADAADDAEAAPKKSSRGRKKPADKPADEPADQPKGRGRSKKGGKAETDSAEKSDKSEQGEKDDAVDKSQGDRQGNQGNQNGKGDSQRSSRTRQRDRKRRGGDDLEPELTEDDVLLPIAGLLDVLDNYAFVRTSGYLPGVSDVYVSLGQVKKYGLRRGDAVVGAIRQPREGEGGGRQKYNALVKLDTVNGRTIEENEKRVDIDNFTPVYPTERLVFGQSPAQGIAAAIDRAAPMGFGQRALITLPADVPAAPVLAELALGVSEAKPDAHLMLVLTNTQPEAVTELQRAIRGEVITATFDRPAEDQLTVVELAVERARRMVELGHDVVLLIDSLSDAAVALAQAVQGGRGQNDPEAVAITQVKRLLAAARNVENGGSLTVIATAREKSHVSLDKQLRRELVPVVNSYVKISGSRSEPEIDAEASFTIGAL